MKLVPLVPAALAILAISASMATAQGPPCPFSGLSIVEYGPGGPPFEYPKFELSLDTTTCSLNASFVKDPNKFIGNYYLTGSYLIYGDAPLTPGITLGDPFFGFDLLVVPIDVLGPLTPSATLPVPPDPGLIGRTFYFQDIGQYLYTLSLPPGIDFILTYGIAATFL